MNPKYASLRTFIYTAALFAAFSVIAWQAYAIHQRRAMLGALTAAGCYWRKAEPKDLVEHPFAVVPMMRSVFGDVPVACIFVGRTPLEKKYKEIGWLFPEAMMPIE